MRGPSERLKYDFRRTWECPECKKRTRTSGQRTSVVCRCQRKDKQPTEWRWMKLVDCGDAE